MNKQEAIEKIEKLKGLNVKDKYFILDIEMIPKGDVLEIIEQIDELEKPVVPPYIDTWIQGCKYNGFDLLEAMTMSIDIPEKTGRWISDNPETFAKAWLYGYEVEKEKRYTAKLKLTDEYLGYESRFEDLLHYKVPDNSAKKEKTYHFTKDDLVKYHIWGNDNYEVKEVEE